jgi:hypothetical protein
MFAAVVKSVGMSSSAPARTKHHFTDVVFRYTLDHAICSITKRLPAFLTNMRFVEKTLFCFDLPAFPLNLSLLPYDRASFLDSLPFFSFS